MNNIDKKIAVLKKEKKLGLMTHAVVGYPNMGKSIEIIKILAQYSDFLELQIPFSDPVADGETIMEASEAALKNGMNTDKAFEIIRNLNLRVLPFGSPMSTHKGTPAMGLPASRHPLVRLRTDKLTPVLVMCYYNQVFRYGMDRFCKKARESGVSGLIVPDIPPEEEKKERFIEACLRYDLYPIRVISPASGEERLRINAKYAKGFVYSVSHFGVTGTKSELDKDLQIYLRRVKKYFNIPIALGFGISSPDQIQKIKGMVDIAIVGSAIINTYNRDGLKGVDTLVKSLKNCTIQKENI
ncbi:tryptophan synthase subunit alpha [Candidatus Gottesmanbacteria bacterium]|nr:tryptophan synthase subunit alpha [Candidatus Gottesmanbacteria bacterium]